jgi:UDP-glucuronate 4-epimerase
VHSRILVTGGAGFIGHHVAARLLERGSRVALLDNFNDFYSPELKRRNVADLRRVGQADLFEVDILDPQGIARAFRIFEPDAVVHLAAWAGVRPSIEHPALYADVNVTGTVNLLEAMRASGTGMLVFGSSSSVYGVRDRIPFTETDPASTPVSPYAATKRAGELIIHTYARNFGLRATCLRFFTVYGPRQRPEMAIHKFARLIRDGEELPIYGDGTTRRDYTFVDDIVAGIVAALDRRLEFEILNLGSSETVSLIELVAGLESALGRKASVRFLPAQAGDVPLTCADIASARRLLGYEPATPLPVGLARFAEWFATARTG